MRRLTCAASKAPLARARSACVCVADTRCSRRSCCPAKRLVLALPRADPPGTIPLDPREQPGGGNMAPADEAVIRRYYEATSRGDHGALEQVLDSNFVLHSPISEQPITGVQ